MSQLRMLRRNTDKIVTPIIHIHAQSTIAANGMMRAIGDGMKAGIEPNETRSFYLVRAKEALAESDAYTAASRILARGTDIAAATAAADESLRFVRLAEQYINAATKAP